MMNDSYGHVTERIRVGRGERDMERKKKEREGGREGDKDGVRWQGETEKEGRLRQRERKGGREGWSDRERKKEREVPVPPSLCSEKCTVIPSACVSMPTHPCCTSWIRS